MAKNTNDNNRANQLNPNNDAYRSSRGDGGQPVTLNDAKANPPAEKGEQKATPEAEPKQER